MEEECSGHLEAKTFRERNTVGPFLLWLLEATAFKLIDELAHLIARE